MNKKTISFMIFAGFLLLIFGSTNDSSAQTETATICVNAFHDENANGQHESNEGFMAGVTFIVANESTVIAQAVSNGTETAVCFENLTPGTYQIAQDVPAPLEMTTAANASIEVGAGTPIGLEFGSRVPIQDAAPAEAETVDTETAVPTPEPAPEESGNNLVAWGGLLVIILAVVLLGIILFALLRR